MATFLFFVGVPLFFGLLQFFLTRSGLSGGKKYLPLALVALTAAVTWGAAFGHVPLPKTYLIDGRSGFLPVRDFLKALPLELLKDAALNPQREIDRFLDRFAVELKNRWAIA